MGDVIKKPENIVFIVIFLCAFLLRFAYLGYSDYQGDENKALYLPKNQSITQFLLGQKKGPVQYIVSGAMRYISGNYRNTFIVRLPFALAGIGSLVYLFLFIKKTLGPATAIFSMIFITTNGFFVAFSRIVQYQSLVMLFISASLYNMYLFSINGRRKYLYITGLLWTLGLLTHSDSMFILPVLAILYLKWVKDNRTKVKPAVLQVLPVMFVMAVFLLSFYIPLILGASADTRDYWAGRFSGKTTTAIVSTPYIFGLYQPVFGFYIYVVLGSLGLLVSIIAIIKNKTKAVYLVSVLTWMMFAWIFMEVLTKYPGTHIWTYVLPLCIVIGFGISGLLHIVPRKLLKVPLFILAAILFTFTFLQSLYIFVDHKIEYPWEPKKFLLWDLPMPRTDYQLSLFGFPYNRSWGEIADFIAQDNRSIYYSSNERVSIARYYIPLTKSNDKAGYFILLKRPQSFTATFVNKRGDKWSNDHHSEKIFFKEGREVAKVYFVPENWGR